MQRGDVFSVHLDRSVAYETGLTHRLAMIVTPPLLLEAARKLVRIRKPASRGRASGVFAVV